MNEKVFFTVVLALFVNSHAVGLEDSAVQHESGLSAVKAVLQSAASVSGASAYAVSEKSVCNFSVASTTPRCVNSIFGLLQMELSLQGLDNSRKIATQILGEGNPNLLVDLKTEGFCISPLEDGCTQDSIDKEVVGLYEPLRFGTDAAYSVAVTNLQAQIAGKLAEFELSGYVIDKVNRVVTPPAGSPQGFSGGTAVAAVLFNQAGDKFAAAIARTDTLVADQAIIKASLLLETARLFFASSSPAATTPASRAPASIPETGGEGFSSKITLGGTKGSSFLASFTDEQKESALIAPQGEEVFGSISGKYKQMQKSGEFIQP